jgi:hypothetical protein
MGKANVATVRSRANWELNFGKLLTAYDKLFFPTVVKEVKTYAQLSNR